MDDQLNRAVIQAGRAAAIARRRLEMLTQLRDQVFLLRSLGVKHDVDLIRSGGEELVVLSVDLTDASMDGQHGPQGARTPAEQDPGCAGGGGAPGHAPPAFPDGVPDDRLPHFLQRW